VVDWRPFDKVCDPSQAEVSFPMKSHSKEWSYKADGGDWVVKSPRVNEA
jgi:hypothetical protein